MLEEITDHDHDANIDLYGFLLKPTASVIRKNIQDRLNSGYHRKEKTEIV